MEQIEYLKREIELLKELVKVKDDLINELKLKTTYTPFIQEIDTSTKTIGSPIWEYIPSTITGPQCSGNNVIIQDSTVNPNKG